MSGTVTYTVPMPRLTKSARFDLRLTQDAKTLVEIMANRDGSSQAAIIERAIRLLARKEGVLADSVAPPTTRQE